MAELDKRYNSKDVESRWYPFWESKGFFKPHSDRLGKKPADKPYVIVIPPPNVTGILHMGHALNITIQDILTRWNRMKGRDTLWIPGVDHAGIATQNVVEKKLAKEKKSRHELGRDKFLAEVWKWKEEHGNTITRQLRRLGASCDWSRERFTMDAGLSRAVRECFVRLYEKNLIYQGHYIINWCPRCQTALSDEEAAHKEVQGGLYHIKYPISGKLGPYEKIGEDHIVVATTRPETMLGDTAVAVHPDDIRYQHLIGKTVVLPLLNREIPVIQDPFVDPEFGTGMVKVTPAHDPNDFEMGQRHNLPQINVMHPDAKMNDNAGRYSGLDRFEARKRVIADLENKGLFLRRDSHLHSVGHCYRCDTIIEPYLSKQWFVKMRPLADQALEAYRAGKTVFYPDRWTKVYTNWLEGIRDWCISRQIWWGHQIPVWYCDHCIKKEGEEAGIIAARETPLKCPSCGNANLRQDPDVLDTWFSSWLWPFSTLGWPDNTEDLRHFYPTTDLVTASEIIFFWVARMIMAGLDFMGEVPYHRIYIHGTVRDDIGRKMSKSLGNSIDPLEVIDETGADALRFSLIMLSSQDVYLSREKFEMGRNFTNKFWNASRFVLMNLEGFENGRLELEVKREALPVASRWILSRLERKTADIEKRLGEFGLSQAAEDVYHLVWNDYCDWFIELAKPALMGDSEAGKKETQSILFFALERICRLLHPFMPFVTEEVWSKLKSIAADAAKWPESVMLAAWPYTDNARFADEDAEKSIDVLQRAVTGMRDLRANLNIPPAQKLEAVIHCREISAMVSLCTFEKELTSLARLSKLRILEEFEKDQSFVGNSFPEFDVYVSTSGLVDVAKERERIEKKIREKEAYVAGMEKKLSNENFVRNAPSEVVEGEKQKLEEARKVLQSYRDHLAILK